jgi:hypothetical protein
MKVRPQLVKRVRADPCLDLLQVKLFEPARPPFFVPKDLAHHFPCFRFYCTRNLLRPEAKRLGADEALPSTQILADFVLGRLQR